MICIIDTTTDPYRNLAAEEYLLKEKNEPVFRLWRNDKAVIVGLNQNTVAEINLDFIKSHHIPVVRRLSGGGAVFHDLGNVNFTFIDIRKEGEDSSQMFRRFTAPIVEALNSIGVKAYLEGRNDLLIDGKKFSGNAICVHKDKILQHGTLLFDASMENLSEALQNRPEKFTGKAVKSNKSRVTNIADHLQHPMDVTEFISFLAEKIGSKYSLYDYTSEDILAIDTLMKTKYSLDSWNFGHSPKYGFSKCRKFPSGLIELYMNVERGTIKDLEIKGDYFFVSPTEDFCRQMIGTELTKEKIADRLSKIPVSDYFSGIDTNDLAGMFFN